MIGLAPINTETGLYGVNFFLSLKGKTQANGIHRISFYTYTMAAINNGWLLVFSMQGRQTTTVRAVILIIFD